jgi:hypothetical protein
MNGESRAIFGDAQKKVAARMKLHKSGQDWNTKCVKLLCISLLLSLLSLLQLTELLQVHVLFVVIFLSSPDDSSTTFVPPPPPNHHHTTSRPDSPPLHSPSAEPTMHLPLPLHSPNIAAYQPSNDIIPEWRSTLIGFCSASKAAS